MAAWPGAPRTAWCRHVAPVCTRHNTNQPTSQRQETKGRRRRGGGVTSRPEVRDGDQSFKPLAAAPPTLHPSHPPPRDTYSRQTRVVQRRTQVVAPHRVYHVHIGARVHEGVHHQGAAQAGCNHERCRTRLPQARGKGTTQRKEKKLILWLRGDMVLRGKGGALCPGTVGRKGPPWGEQSGVRTQESALTKSRASTLACRRRRAFTTPT